MLFCALMSIQYTDRKGAQTTSGNIQAAKRKIGLIAREVKDLRKIKNIYIYAAQRRNAGFAKPTDKSKFHSKVSWTYQLANSCR